jgi:2-methylcitrate dehydratase PrpD
VRSRKVQEFMKRCRHVVDKEIDGRGFQHMDTRIVIALKDGQKLEKVESFATGHPKKPMTHEQLEHKFLECAELAIDRERAERSLDTLWRLEELEHVGKLHEMLVG